LMVAATPAEKAQLIWLYRVDRAKVIIVPPGVNLRRFYPVSPYEAKARLGIQEQSDVLLFVGRIERLKALDSALSAVDLLIRREPSQVATLRFLVVGGDENSSDLNWARNSVRDLELNDIVRFVGSKEQNILRDYYASAFAVVMPSDYESFGLVALEAMACGVPVIASGVGGLAYLVRDGETGFLVPSRDPYQLSLKIQILCDDPEIRGKLSDDALTLAREYSWSAIAEWLLSVFQGILGVGVVDSSPRMS
jgi:D-inositol-3-phosphate glycosyltransferase